MMLLKGSLLFNSNKPKNKEVLIMEPNRPEHHNTFKATI